MDISYEEVGQILRLIEELDCDTISLEVGDFKLHRQPQRRRRDAAGVAPARLEWTSERVLDATRAHIDRQGHPPLSSDWRRPEHDEIPATHVVINRFGCWRAAIAAAGRGETPRGEPS